MEPRARENSRSTLRHQWRHRDSCCGNSQRQLSVCLPSPRRRRCGRDRMTTMKDVPQLHHGGMLAFQVRFLTTAKRAAPTSYLVRISSKAAQTTHPHLCRQSDGGKIHSQTVCRIYLSRYTMQGQICYRLFRRLPGSCASISKTSFFTDFGRGCIIERENVTNACHTAPSLHGAVSLDYLFLGCHGRPY